MPVQARRGPQAPESRKPAKPPGSSTPRGPQAFRGPMVAPEVLEDAQQAEAKAKAVTEPAGGTGVPVGTMTVVDMTPPSPPPTPSPSPPWVPVGEIRFDPGNPLVQAVTLIQPSTGAVAEMLVGPGVDSHLRPAGSPLPAQGSNPPSAAEVAAPGESTAATEVLDQA